eukprot:scaffold33887_cov67-Attheya_sp.AAC.1
MSLRDGQPYLTQQRRLTTAVSPDATKSSDADYFRPWENKYPDASENLLSDLLPVTKGRFTTMPWSVDDPLLGHSPS